VRAVVLSEDRPNLEVADLDDPTPGPGQVLLHVTGCGICGTDLHVASHLAPAGMVLGHEIVGTVAELGAGVDRADWAAGTPVAARPFIGCGHCAHCVRGRADHCVEFELVGLQRPGGFAELTVVQADELYRLPAGVTGDVQTLVEPLAVARRAARRADLRPGDTVAVLGAGPIGLAMVAWARHLGVEQILVSDPAPVRRDLALTLGASAVLDPSDGLAELAIVEATAGGPSVVFECTGRPGLAQAAMNVAAVDGRVVVVGVCIAPDSTVHFIGLSKELDVRYALYYGREDFVDTIAALDAGTLDAAPMITEVVGLDALPERFARLAAEGDGGKVVVRP
jgi:(R,R)-butanediol dehydrogenase/meso-butanediol dehydrogenase/diacetyl reductase